MFNPFNPFDKDDLSSVGPDDLVKLKDTHEGWYVEYKREPINAVAIGKSISSFSNHFGGWLIFGVSAPDRVPEAFPGLGAAQCQLVAERTIAAANAHVNPLIRFETRRIRGPCASIGLADDRSIFVVRIPQGHNPPYVHSSGRIYRRVDDSSEPKAEVDRAVIDQLLERNRRYQEQFREWIERKPEIGGNELDVPFLHLYLTNDRWREQSIKNVLNHREFSEIMRKPTPGYSMEFENVFPMANGFIARHVAANDPFNMLSTYRFTHGGNSTVTMALRMIDARAIEEYQHASDFMALLSPSLRERVFDATMLWVFFAVVIARHEELSRAIGLTGDLHMKCRFLNIWRRVPYLDTSAFVEHTKRHGVPVIQEKESLIPIGTDPESMIKVADVHDMEEPVRVFAKAGHALWLLRGIGVNAETLVDGGLKEMWPAIERARKVHGAH